MRTIIIGAGLAGMAAAVRLAAAGHRITLIEATKAGGGRARSFVDAASGREYDNGQHLVMACYRETLAFLRQLGSEDGLYFQRNLQVDLVRPGGARVALRCPPLPAPLHLATGLLTMRGVGLLHKAAALRAGLLLSGEVRRPDDNETCDAWLTRLGQTAGIRHVFWEPLIWGVLNDDPLVASAAMLMAVLERGFMSTRDASRLGVPRIPLSRLYVDQALAFLEQRGAEIHMGASARALEIRDQAITGVTLRSGETLAADHVISTVPPRAFLDLLPEGWHRHPVHQDIARLTTSPIVNLWIVLDRPLFTDTPFLGLVNGPIHWLFNRSLIDGEGGGGQSGETLLNCTISAARSAVVDSPESLIELFHAEMRRYFPTKTYTIRHYRVIKEKRATISHAAGSYHWRPETQGPIRGLYMAGDWVRTGLPATIESAVQSGHEAAEAVFRAGASV